MSEQTIPTPLTMEQWNYLAGALEDEDFVDEGDTGYDHLPTLQHAASAGSRLFYRLQSLAPKGAR